MSQPGASATLRITGANAACPRAPPPEAALTVDSPAGLSCVQVECIT